MDSYREDIYRIEDMLNHLQGKKYISESTINFFRDIIRAQYSIKSQLDETEATAFFAEDEIKRKMEEGEPLLSWDSIPLKASCLKELFSKICEIMKGQKNTDVEGIQRLIDVEGSGSIDLNTLIKKLFYHDSEYFHTLSDELKVSKDLLIFVTLHLAKPFFEAAAVKVKSKVVEKLWLRHYCPVCGSVAQLARLEKDVGKKILCCQLCGSEWRYMRVKCPFCCSEEQKKLKFLEEEKGPYRIDLCEKCKRYIKTLDERKGGYDRGEIIPAVEDIATIYLDMLAEEEGYKRSWFFPPSAEQIKVGEGKRTLH